MTFLQSIYNLSSGEYLAINYIDYIGQLLISLIFIAVLVYRCYFSV